jgi:hypothetical protein
MSTAPAFADDVPVRCAAHATATALDADAAVVLDLNSQTYYELNEAGYVLWSYLQEHDQATAPELAEALRAHANATSNDAESALSQATARAHTDTFLQSMRAVQLIVPAS